MDIFLVERIFWNGQGSKSHSCEEFPTFNDAKKRMYTILGSDIGKDSVAYEIVTILNGQGIQIMVEIVDNRVAEEPVEE